MTKIPPRFVDADWNKVPKAVKEKISANLKAGKGVYLYGEVGSGKTYIVYALIKRAKELGVSTRIHNTTDLFRIIRDSYGKKYESYYDNTLQMILDFKGILILDDIGVESATDWVQETLYGIVNKRYEEKQVTIFTSNLKIGQLAEKVGDRIASRIVEMCDVIQLEGTDKRLKTNK